MVGKELIKKKKKKDKRANTEHLTKISTVEPWFTRRSIIWPNFLKFFHKIYVNFQVSKFHKFPPRGPIKF